MRQEFKRFFQGFQVVVMASLLGPAANYPGRFPAQVSATQSTSAIPQPAPSISSAPEDPALVGLFNADTDVPTARLKLIEDAIFNYSNKKRTDIGLAPYPTDSKLLLVARAKSQDMAVTHYFNHPSPTGKVLEDRIDTFQVCGGKDCPVVGENLAVVNFGNLDNASYWLKTDELADARASSIVDNLMSDAGHRGNILDTDFEEMAVGVSVGDDGSLYVTQDFVRFESLERKAGVSR